MRKSLFTLLAALLLLCGSTFADSYRVHYSIRGSGRDITVQACQKDPGQADIAPLELRVIGRNLLNEEVYASQDVRTVLAPGRSVSLVAAVKF